MRYPPRIRQLIELLRQAQKPLNSQEIGAKLGIKARTLRVDIARYREDLAEDGLLLLSRQGRGYELIILDGDKCAALLRSFHPTAPCRQAAPPRTLPERVNFLIRTLLAADDYRRLDEIADEMCVSRSTLNNCMKEAREALAPYGLKTI